MISAAEIKKVAGALQVATNVVEHDHVLGCFLRFLSKEKSVKDKWVFKGGTALAKCYFDNYRFSEDEEHTAFPFDNRITNHPYGDDGALPGEKLRVYSLEEMFVEKLRAISGQRRFAISRDLYDIYHLSAAGINTGACLEALKSKCEPEGIRLEPIILERLEERRDEYKSDWNTNLVYLVPAAKHITFESAWEVSTSYLKRGITLNRQSQE